MDISVPSCGFLWRHDRFYAVTEARRYGSQAIPALALSGSGGVWPRVVNVDGHSAYGRAIAELKDSRDLRRRCLCRPSPYLNNIIEQDYRFIKMRIIASLGFRSPDGAWRTIEGYEAMHMIRKGQVRWWDKGDVIGQRQFIHRLFGIAA
jgi:IS6 family transposase